MFRYDDLSEIQKQIIMIIGDPLKSTPIEPYTNIKNRKKIFNDYFDKKMTYEKFELILENLYFIGMISFVPASIGSINNMNNDCEIQFQNNYKLEVSWRNQDPFVRLTSDGERTISGTMIYMQIIREDINNNYNKLQSIVDDLGKDAKEVAIIKNKIDSSLAKNIEVMSIFIAIFTLILGNTGIFTFLKDRPLFEIVSLVFIVNGTLLLSLAFLLIGINNFILDRSDKNNGIKKYIRYLMFPILIIIVGIIFVA